MSLGTLCHVILVVNKPSTTLNSLSNELFNELNSFPFMQLSSLWIGDM